MNIDPNELARLYLCGIQECKQLPKVVAAATDGYFYCKDCIERYIEINSGSTEVIPSPVTGEPLGKTLVYPKTIQSLIGKLVESGSVRDEYLIKWNGSSVDDDSETVRETKERAEGGSAEHMSLLSRWYIFGEKEGIDSDEDEAFKWCKKAADLDDADGKAYLGYCYVHGFGVDKDRDEGYECLVDASCEGSEFAAYTLGSLFHTGLRGFKHDATKAKKQLTRAKDLAKKKGNRCVLSEVDLNNIDRYLAVYSRAENVDTGASSSQSIDHCTTSSNIPCRSIHGTENDTTISLTPHSA